MVLGICLMPGMGLPSWRSLIISAKAIGYAGSGSDEDDGDVEFAEEESLLRGT